MAKLTAAEEMPARVESVFSMRRAQLAQDMPVIFRTDVVMIFPKRLDHISDRI